MRIKRVTLILIIMIVFLIVKPSYAAEEFKITENLALANFTQSFNTNPNDSFRLNSHRNRPSNSYSLETPSKSEKIDLPVDLPFPLEIGPSEPKLFDPAIRLGLDPKTKEKELSCTFGIKYSFSRFEFQHFAKSLVSLFTNMNTGASRKNRKRSRPVSFYLYFPDF